MDCPEGGVCPDAEWCQQGGSCEAAKRVDAQRGRAGRVGVTLADLTLTCSEGAIYLHDVGMTEEQFTFLGQIADRFCDEDPGGYTPALRVARAPLEVTDEYCRDCMGTRPIRGSA